MENDSPTEDAEEKTDMNQGSDANELEGDTKELKGDDEEHSFVEENMSVQESLKKIQMEKAEIQKLLAETKAQIKAMTKACSADVLSDIRWNGLFLGQRWRIAEEGSNSYQALVFRDMLNTYAGNDKRYAMFKFNYRDL